MTKLKLAIVATHPIQYNAPVFRHLARAGVVQPHIFYTWSQTQGGKFFDREFGAGIVWDVPLLGGYDHTFINNTARNPGPHHFRGIRTPELCDAIASWGAHAVLVFGWNNESHLKVMRHFKGRLPVFFRGDSTLLDRQPWLRSRLRRMLLNWVYRHIDVAISVGQNSRDYFSWCGVPSSHISFAPHCIDNLRFEDSQGVHQQQANAWRTQLGIGSNDVVFVFAGKLIGKKDPGLLLDAFLQTKRHAHLVFFGSGEQEDALRSKASGHARIHFMPFQNQSLMPAVYRVGNLLVLPSCGPGETWGLALNEAMASRRAVIASSMVGGSRDLIHHGRNGWRFTAGNRDELATLLDEAVEHGPDKLQQLGDQGYQLIQDWSTESSALKIGEAIVSYCATRVAAGIAPLPCRI